MLIVDFDFAIWNDIRAAVSSLILQTNVLLLTPDIAKFLVNFKHYPA
jgi:hypothetical protein